MHPSATIRIPGSKSDTNRALILAAIMGKPITLYGVSSSDDSVLLITAMQQLGAEIVLEGDILIFTKTPDLQTPFFGELNSGIAGTTSRFLAALSALIPGNFCLEAEGKMRTRPMAELLDALGQLGASITFLDNQGCLPVQFQNTTLLTGTHVRLAGSVSSQFFTALLLIAPRLQQGLTIQVMGEQISQSYIDMTINILRAFGVTVENHNYQQYQIEPGFDNPPTQYWIEGDASGCSYFWAMAAVTGQTVRIENISTHSVQGDTQFPFLLKKMGCTVVSDPDKKWIEVTGASQLRAIECDMGSMPDTAQTLAVVAAFAQGTTRITGLSSLRHKETDRLAAVRTELSKMNITVRTGEDWMEIDGGNPQPAQIATYHDHRMAMSFAVAQAVLPTLTILQPEVVSKSFPDFWQYAASVHNQWQTSGATQNTL